MTGALLDPQRQVARDAKPAEGFFQSFCFQRDRHDASLSGTAIDGLAAGELPDHQIGQPQRPAMHAVAADQHDHDQHEADPEQPVLRRDGLKHLLEHFEHDGADQPAIEIAGTADHEYQHQVGGFFEREHVERSQRRGLGEQRAGDAGIKRRHRIDRDQAAIDGNADGGSAQRIVPDGAQRQAERRVHDPARQQEHQEQHDQRIEEAGLAEHVEGKQAEDRRHLDALQPVSAAGDIGKTFAQRFQQQRDAERHHQPGQVDAPDHQKTGEEAEHHRDQPGGDQRQHRLGDDAMQRQQSRAIGADAEERGVAQ